MSLLNRIIECLNCKCSCWEKELCSFSIEEFQDVAKIASRIYGRDLDHTLSLRYGLFAKINGEVALRATLATIGLASISRLIEDPQVEDLTIIPGRYIYVTTSTGKRKTDVFATLRLVRSVLKLAQLKGVELTTANPSFKFGVKIGGLKIRISIDLPPIVPLPQSYLRIHRKKITILDLVNSGFAHVDQIKEIVKNVRSGRHIVVTGPPGSGKTTLLAALDDLIPSQLQRVYIDEADEFDDDPEKNQIKISSVHKVREVFASLNRNIDLFFIGELQYEDHFHAFKTATEIGLQTFATMHSTNLEDAIKRLSRYTEVKNMVIVQLEKRYENAIRRRIAHIYVS